MEGPGSDGAVSVSIPSLLKDRKGVHLALGGGAARSLAHLGVIKALQENGIPIASISGTSMGAIVGAAYALAPDVNHVLQDFADYLNSKQFNHSRYAFLRKVHRGDRLSGKTNLRQRLSQGYLLGRSLTTGAIIPFEEFEAEVKALIPAKTFYDTKIPFFAVSLDLNHAKEVVFDQGYLRSALLASSAIPGILPPVKSGETIYVDGGWINKIPVLPLLAFGAPHVIAVDVSDLDGPGLNPKRGLSIMSQTYRAGQIRLQELQTERANLYWRPPLGSIHWAEFTEMEHTVEIGYRYAQEHMEDVFRLLAPRPRLSRWRGFLFKLAGWRPPEPRLHNGFEVRAIWEAVMALELDS